MKKPSHPENEDLRAEYKPTDFPSGLVRGKYAARVALGSNIVVLDPEISAAFPTSESVNAALSAVLRLTTAVAKSSVPSSGPRKSQVASSKGP